MMDGQMVRIEPCAWMDIRDHARRVYEEERVLVDSYIEDHILAANCYRMVCEGELVGYFAIHAKEMMVLFHVFDAFGRLAQPLFERAKKYEQVTHAMLPTDDKQFLSLAVDNYARLEKQAYYAMYPGIAEGREVGVSLRRADMEKDRERLALSKGFLDEEIPKCSEDNSVLRIYIAERDGETVGFGVIQFSTFLNIASIGMYVCEDYRRHGYAGDILYLQRQIVEQEGYVPISGCWYYNHNSKKSMESIGGNAKTRLLKFYF